MKGFKEFLEWENLSRFLKENAFKIVIMIVIFKIAKYVKKHIDKGGFFFNVTLFNIVLHCINLCFN